MRKYIITMLLAAVVAMTPAICAAAPSAHPDKEHKQQPRPHKKGDFKDWMEQMRKYKHDFLIRELKLTDEQKAAFLPLYDKMSGEKWKMERDVRHMERDVRKKGAEATDLELDKAADAAVELAGRQNEVERRYHAEFKKILTSRQLFDLQQAERKFNKSLMEQRGKKKK